MRRLAAVALGMLALAAAAQPVGPTVTVVESSIADLRRAMEAGRITSREITAQSLARIARYEDRLNAVISLNPRAIEQAEALDRERRAGRLRGPLHGIPIALKDNIHTTDMPTTGGTLAFARLQPPYDATITRRLRDAGAIILAKTTMTELANWVATDMPNGYSGLAGFSVNPYALRLSPGPPTREQPEPGPGGSSSGIGTAASFWAASIGTETSGSILNPSNQTMLVGIKPTVGRISRYGVIPITADQDTPGPMARSVADAALLLGILEGAADPNDSATGRCAPPPDGDYTQYLRADALRGARIGIPRAGFYEAIRTPHHGLSGGLRQAEREVMADAIDALARAGAVIVDPADLPSALATTPLENLLDWSICTGRASVDDADCSMVLQYGMKRDFNAWLRTLGDRAPVRTLGELRAWNLAHEADGAIRFGQDQLDGSDAIDLEADRPRYLADRAHDVRLAGREGIDAAIATHRLDALLFPAYYGSSVPARVGYPSIIVPFGMVPNGTISFRDPTAALTPFGVTFTGTACSEGRLVALAYAFEQATRRRAGPDIGD